MQTLNIKRDKTIGEKLINVHGRTVTVLCEDGNEYKQTFPTKQKANEAMQLVAIVVDWGWKKV